MYTQPHCTPGLCAHHGPDTSSLNSSGSAVPQHPCQGPEPLGPWWGGRRTHDQGGERILSGGAGTIQLLEEQNESVSVLKCEGREQGALPPIHTGKPWHREASVTCPRSHSYQVMELAVEPRQPWDRVWLSVPLISMSGFRKRQAFFSQPNFGNCGTPLLESVCSQSGRGPRNVRV